MCMALAWQLGDRAFLWRDSVGARSRSSAGGGGTGSSAGGGAAAAYYRAALQQSN